MNLVDEFDVHTSPSSIGRMKKSAGVYIYKCGNMHVCIVRELDVEGVRSVTNGIEFVATQIGKYMRFNNDVGDDLLLITGYEPGHPNEDLGYSSVWFNTATDVDFKYIGKTMEDVEKYLIMQKLKHG